MNQVTQTPAAAFVSDDREAQINQTMRTQVMVDSRQQDWQGSPADGVKRKRLELIGDDQPQLTTLVEFEPGSEFPRHTHDGGEEFLVLSGVFSDAEGDYGAGCYVRNPPGTAHAPYTLSGCQLFVKLRQFSDGDNQRIVKQISQDTLYQTIEGGGITVLQLHTYDDEDVCCYRLTRGAGYSRRYDRGVEMLLLSGRLELNGSSLSAGYWLRCPPGTAVRMQAVESCEIWIKEGPLDRFL